MNNVKFEIKSKFDESVIFSVEAPSLTEAVESAVKAGAYLSGANLYWANLFGANLSGAYLSGANLSRANLSGAYLSGAYLSGANLFGADLSGADLSGAWIEDADFRNADLRYSDLRRAQLSGTDFSDADLRGADLQGANLYMTKGINPNMCARLLMLLDQPGKIRAYKLVNGDGEGPFNGGIKYEVGKTHTVDNANTDTNIQCGTGINLATLDWCVKYWAKGYKILIAEFTADDIAAIPTATDGQFRVKRCRIVGMKNLESIEKGG